MIYTADNRAYLVPCLRHFAQILLRRTSDTLGTLYAMPCLKKEKGDNDGKSKF